LLKILGGNKMNIKRKILALLLTGNLLVPVLAAPAFGTDNSVCGGWDEKTGYFESVKDYNESLKKNGSISILSTPQHTGCREDYTESGQTYFRAHGWTTWVGVYHYTRARMETDFGGILTDSGRQWGSDGTEAISPWWAFDPDFDDHARTYYGY
jgi:hypothetical protein